MIDPKVFKEYDIRGVADVEFDEEGIEQIAKAVVSHFKPSRVQIGHDMRLTSDKYHKKMIETFLSCGVDVVNLGLLSTDMLYLASAKYDSDISITISASHNPPEYNGIKMVKKGAVAISLKDGLDKVREIVRSENFDVDLSKKGTLSEKNIMDDWISHVLSFIDVSKIKNLNAVVDPGNGMAGYYLPELEKNLPIKMTHLDYKLDGSFPSHPANPTKSENMQDCVDMVKKTSANFGMSFDGDADRVFMVDETGKILSATVLTALIADNLLKKNPGETILYNAVIGKIVPEIVEQNGGRAIRVKVGSATIKPKMRETNAIFCGESSGHFYFRENFFADSGIIAALQVIELMSTTGKKLSELALAYRKYYALEEESFEVTDKESLIKSVEEKFTPDSKSVDHLDGLSIWFEDFWFNIRASNTEPLVRLNLEADSEVVLEREKNKLVEFIKNSVR